jgi:pectate lyase
MGKQNMINNYYKAGPATQKSVLYRIIEPFDSLGRWYIDGNYVSGSKEISADNWNGGVQGDFAEAAGIKVEVPFTFAPVKTQTAEEAYRAVLRDAGATLPHRDTHDQRIISEVVSGTCKFGDSYGAGTGIIDSQNNTEGWPELNTYNIQTDTDKDGMPDAWERKMKLDPLNPEDRNIIAKSGYTMLEEYINSIEAR